MSINLTVSVSVVDADTTLSGSAFQWVSILYSVGILTDILDISLQPMIF